MNSVHLKVLFISIFILVATGVKAQNTQTLTIEEVVELAMKNHPQLKSFADGCRNCRATGADYRASKTPAVTFSSTASYLGDIFTLDKNFGNKNTIHIPNFGNTFGLQAGQLLFKGGMVKKSIEAADLRAQLSLLDFEKDKQSIKFLVISNYLDIIRINNQIQVLNNNKQLAETRLRNVKDFYSQGMVTRNEVIRGELAIQNIEQALLTATNNRKIINYQLNMALGLHTETNINPADNKTIMPAEESMEYYFNAALENNPFVLSGKKNIELANKNIELIKTDLVPSIAAVGGYNMQRPLTSSLPAQDLYLNTWQAGLSLSYNLDNLFKTKQRLKSGKLAERQAFELLELTRQNIITGVNAAYIKYKEAMAQSNLAREAKKAGRRKL